MRIALVHSFYASTNPSGENAAVLEQARALEAAGHAVAIIARHTDEQSRAALYPIVSALRVSTGRGDSPVDELSRFKPDVVHIHNLFPNFGTTWVDEWSGPLVATLHNYRYACANAVLLRAGSWCTKCPDGSSLSAVRHGCYRSSPVASIPLALANRRGLGANPVIRRADRLVVLSPLAQGLFTRFGASADRQRLVPNFARQLHDGATPQPAREAYLTVGRLTAEKGFASLVGSWPAGRPLDIIGSAAEDSAVELPQHHDVRLRGAIDNATWRSTLAQYTAMVVPSAGPEGAVPLVAIEAWEAGVPVVTPADSGLGAYVTEAGTGATYVSPATLATALEHVSAAGQGLRDLSRAAYEAGFTESAWVDGILAVYSEAVASR